MTDLDVLDFDGPATAAAPTAIPPDLAGTYVAANRYGFLERAGGLVRYAEWNVPGTVRGTVVVLPGRGEFIEKYATEIVGELLGRGYSVMAMDWRGQGLSDRPLADRNKAHIDSFATYIADLQLFLDKVVSPLATRPVVALCHSMGAHIALRTVAQNGPGPLSAAVLVSPMTALRRVAALHPDADAAVPGHRGTLPVRYRTVPGLRPRVPLQLRDPRRAALPLHRAMVRSRSTPGGGRPDGRLGTPGDPLDDRDAG